MMTEQAKHEKIISGIEHHIKGQCKGCPYCKGWHACEAASEKGLFMDALALLKAQEAVEPIIETHWETPSVYDNDVKVTENKCGACGAEIDKWDKYCRVCGRAVKWE